MRARNVIAAAAVCVAILAGCTSAPGPGASPEPVVSVNFDELVREHLADAQESNVDPTQIEALERAKSAGEVTAGDFIAQRYAALDCMTLAGIEVTNVREVESTGLKRLDATIAAGAGMTDDELLALSDECNLRYALILEMVYIQQPTALNLWFGHIESFREPILACLRDHGMEIPDNAPIDELFSASEEVNLREAERTGQPVDCLVESGATPID